MGEIGLLNICSRNHGSNDSDLPRERLATRSPSRERQKVGLRSSGALGQGIGLAAPSAFIRPDRLGLIMSGVELWHDHSPVCHFASVRGSFAAHVFDQFVILASFCLSRCFLMILCPAHEMVIPRPGRATRSRVAPLLSLVPVLARRLVAGGANHDHLLLHVLPSL
ncbi:hypothetical protein R1flu_018729 [Riccia fluitans]|uniref:Uncharacterized protein n=1 Tax=Riccia fluitans TaxID=41844 RepID=A0ABD1ZIZ0_9MARC